MRSRFLLPTVLVSAALVAASALTGCTAVSGHSAAVSKTGTVHAADASTSPLTPAQQEATAPLTEADATYPQNENLTDDQIWARFQQIDSSYVVGQAFDAADAQFVRIYAQANTSAYTDDPTPTIHAVGYLHLVDSLNYDKSHTAGGITGRISGNLNDNGSGPLTHHYSVTVNMTSSAKTTKTHIEADIRSYGVIGSSGIGLAYQTSPSLTTTQHSYAFDRSGTYTSVEAYDTIQAEATFYSTSTSFTVQS